MREYPLLSSFLKPVAFAFDVNGSTVMKDPIKNSRRNHMVAKYLAPLSVRLV
jgi:hypothetical protein